MAQVRVSELAVRMQSLEQVMPCLRRTETGSSVRQRTEELWRLGHIINTAMGMDAVINGSQCADF